jgi:photosystem II stability/assembly factor-like uncharacterized protein
METVVKYIIGISIFLLAGCKKDQFEIWPAKKIQLPKEVRINAIHVSPDGTVRAGGGIRGKEAWLFTSHDAGQDWNAQFISNRSSLYCIDFINDTLGWLGGDTLHLWRTTDGSNWNFFWLSDQVPTHESDRPAVRQISHRGANQLCFAAGDLYYHGASFTSDDSGENWHFAVADNAVYQASFYGSKPQTFGYGTAMHYVNDQWQTLRAPADHLVSVLPLDDQTAIAASVLGHIYRLNTTGVTEEKIALPTKQALLWMCGAQFGERLVFGASGGEIALSTDRGTTWTIRKLENSPVLLSLAADATGIWAGSESGQLYHLNWP